MQKTSDLYKQIITSPYTTETRLAIGEAGLLTDNYGDTILFGGDAILVDTGGPESGFDETMLLSVTKPEAIFKDGPTIGATPSQTVEITMQKPISDIPYLARLALYTRVRSKTAVSEWLPAGVFFADTDYTTKDNRVPSIKITGFDAMLLAEQDYPSSTMDWPARDVDILWEIADFLNTGVESDTMAMMTKDVRFPYPAGYSCREVLSFLGIAYAGSFVIDEAGDLRLIPFNGIPRETSLLVDEDGDVIVFGADENEVSILV